MYDSMENLINNLGVIIVIEALNDEFSGVYNKATIDMLRRANISNEEIEELQKQKESYIPDLYSHYLEGHCVSYSDILCSIFDGYAVRYRNKDHVIVKIGEHFYDVRGLIDDIVLADEFEIVNDNEALGNMYNNLAPLKKDSVEKAVEEELISIGKEKLSELIKSKTL